MECFESDSSTKKSYELIQNRIQMYTKNRKSHLVRFCCRTLLELQIKKKWGGDVKKGGDDNVYDVCAFMAISTNKKNVLTDSSSFLLIADVQ